LKDFRALGYEVASVTYDPVEKLADFATRRSIGFAMLSDPNSAIIRAFGVLDGRYPGHAIARPIVFVIGPDGVIRQRFSEGHYTERPDIDLLLKTLRERAGS